MPSRTLSAHGAPELMRATRGPTKMGWLFRRSRKVGPFRFTLSKGGLGMSVGVKGARIGIGADGRARSSVSIPGTGLSYRTTAGPGHPVERAGYPSQPQGYPPPPSGGGCLSALMFISGSIGLLGGGVLWVMSSYGTAIGVGVLSVAAGVGGIVRGQRDRERAGLEAEQLQRAHAAHEEELRLNAEQQHQQQLAFAEEQRQRAHAVAEQERRERRERLVAMFGQDGADHVFHRKLWIGAPEAAAIEAFGPPDEVEERALKTKTKRILKYRDALHSARYSVKVTIENGAVVGWEDKDA
jgi:hypothetical protein